MPAIRDSKAQRLLESRALRAKAPIAAEFEDCFQIFVRLSDALHLNQLHELVERCWRRFTFWDNDSGASSRTLDYALRGSPSLVKETESLLHDLRWTLGQAIVAVPLGDPDDDDASGLTLSQSRNEMVSSSVETAPDDIDADFGPEPWLEEALDIVANLVQILPALRNPMEETLSTDALQNDNGSFLQGGYQQVAHDLFPDAEGALIKRLAQVHWRTRCTLPGPLNASDTRSNPRDELNSFRRAYMPRHPARRQGWSVRRKRTTIQASLRADSDAGTSTVRSHIDTVMSRTAVVEQTSATSIGASSQSYHIYRPRVPDPPVELDQLGRESFDCPYCHFELPIVVGAGMSYDTWVEHFYDDMKPYICTFSECNRRDIPFASREEWFQHELDLHRTLALWTCGLCAAEYQHENDFKLHLQSSTHADLSLPKDLSPLIQSCKRLSHIGAPVQSCVLCHGVCRSLEDLESHLGNHMEAFVIETTRENDPWAADDQENDDMVLEFVSEQMNLRNPVMEPVDDNDDEMGSATHVGGPGDKVHFDVKAGNILGSDRFTVAEARRKGSDWTEKVTNFLDGQPDAVGTTLHNLPDQYENFAGREQDLLGMHDSLSTPGRVCVLSGRSGIGKTATAVQYAYRFSNEFSYVFWVEAETAGILADKYGAIADVLDLKRDGNRDDNSSTFLVRDALSKLDRRWLLIFDNVDSWNDVSRYITKALTYSKGSVLITTRADPLRTSPTWMHQRAVKLGPLDLEDGREFLLTSVYPRIRKDDLKDHEEFELAGKTVELLGGLPLAISMVVGYVKESRCTLGDFHEMWDEKEARSKKPTRPSTNGLETIDSTIDALWDIGIREVQMSCRKLLDIFAFLDPDQIPKKLLVGDHEEDFLDLLNAAETLRYKRMIKQLKSRRLITVKEMTGGDSVYSIHRMLKSKILDDMDDYSIADAFRKTFRLLQKKFPRADPQQVPDPGSWDACQENMPHINSLHQVFLKERNRIERLAGTDPRELADLFYDAGFYLWARRATAYGGLELLRTAESILDKINLDRDSKVRADINCIIGLLLLEMGCAERRMGSKHLLEVRRIRQTIYEQHPDDHDHDVLATNAVSDFVLSLMNNNRFVEAGKDLLHCRERYMAWGDVSDNPFENSKFFGNYGIVLMFQGEMEKAIESVSTSLELTERFSGQNAQYYRRIFLLASIHTQAGNLQKALELHLEALEARLRLGGQHSMEFILSLYAVGATHHHLGNLEEATEYIRQCLECSNNSRWTTEAHARAQFHLGLLYELQGIEAQKAQSYKAEAISVLDSTMRSVTECVRDSGDTMSMFDDLQPTLLGRYTGRELLKCLQANLPRS